MKTRPSNTAPRWTVKAYPPRRTMNPALDQRFVGLDIEGKNVSGRIWHVGNYSSDGEPATYVLLLDNNGHRNQTAVISADTVREHLKGLALCASMEADSE